MQMSTTQKSESLKEKIPDIQKTLDMVEFIDSKKVRRKKKNTIMDYYF